MAIEIIRYSTETYQQMGIVNHTDGQIIGVAKSGQTPDGSYFEQMMYELTDKQTVVFTHKIRFEGEEEETFSQTLVGNEINTRGLIFDLEGFSNQKGQIKYKP